MITDFSGDHDFLSNFYPSPIVVGQLVYPTVEHAFQGLKTFDKDQREAIRAASSPGLAKKLGRKATLRADWEAAKFDTMYSLVRSKFLNSPKLADKLAETAPHPLIEGNTWHDQIWGDCSCLNHATTPGLNALGNILMFLRLEIMGLKTPRGG